MTLHLIPGRTRNRHRGKSGLQLQRELAAAERKIASLTAGIDQISAGRTDANDRAEKAAIDLGIAREEIRQLEETVRLRDRRIADLERRVDVGIKAEHVIAQTQEIPVITPVVPLHQSPLANPAHVPAWVQRD